MIGATPSRWTQVPGPSPMPTQQWTPSLIRAGPGGPWWTQWAGALPCQKAFVASCALPAEEGQRNTSSAPHRPFPLGARQWQGGGGCCLACTVHRAPPEGYCAFVSLPCPYHSSRPKPDGPASALVPQSPFPLLPYAGLPTYFLHPTRPPVITPHSFS